VAADVGGIAPWFGRRPWSGASNLGSASSTDSYVEFSIKFHFLVIVTFDRPILRESSSIPDTRLKTAWIWPVSQHRKHHDNAQAVLGLCHGSNGLYLLKLISISLSCIHTRHVMCGWTHLDPSFIPDTQNSLDPTMLIQNEEAVG
jgi:hypothetical protein